jgi:hypothetical protein
MAPPAALSILRRLASGVFGKCPQRPLRAKAGGTPHLLPLPCHTSMSGFRPVRSCWAGLLVSWNRRQMTFTLICPIKSLGREGVALAATRCRLAMTKMAFEPQYGLSLRQNTVNLVDLGPFGARAWSPDH